MAIIRFLIIFLLFTSLVFAGPINEGPISSGGGGAGGVTPPGGAAGDVQCNIAGGFGTCVNLTDVAYQPFAANLSLYAAIAPSANMQTFLGSGTFASMRVNLSLVPGTNVQTQNAKLQAIADLANGAGVLTNNGAGVFSYTTNVATANALAANPTDCGALGVATAIDANGNLTCGYAISTDIQAYSVNLARLAAMTVDATANTVGITNGTASINVAAGIAADINAALTVNTALVVQTGAVTITGNAGGSSGLVLPNGSVTLPLPTAAGQFAQASGAGVFANSAYKLPTTVPTDKYILTSNGTDIVGSNTLQIGTLNVPSANADPTAATAGQLAHDTTDTAASGGGNMKFADGTNVRTIVSVGTTFTHVTKYEWLPIRAAEDGASAPAAIQEVSDHNLFYRAFDKASDEDVQFNWQVPGDYVSGIKYRVYYVLGIDGLADESVIFGLAGCSMTNSEDSGCTVGDAVTVTDEIGTSDDQYELMVTDWSTAVTLGGTPAAGELARLKLYRDADAVADDYDTDAWVVGIEVKYVGKLNPFSDY
jgi:hypothetical protein